jgi:hypothetical protein
MIVRGVRAMVIIMIALAIILISRIYFAQDIDSFQTESDLVISSILFSNEGISFYNQKIDRLYPMVVDPSKINSAQLENLIVSEANVAVQVTLKDSENKIIKGPAYLNKELYSKLNPLIGRKGPGGVRENDKKVKVEYIGERIEERSFGNLEISVLVPNS